MILTDARAGIARAAATRSGYPVLEGVLVPLYALSAIARSGATRSNYTGSDLFWTIDGVPIDESDARILYAGASIVDTLDETPTTATLTTYGSVAGVGDRIAIGVGSANNLRKLFAGTVLSATRRYQGKPAHGFDDLKLIDDTWQLGQLIVRARYTATTVAAIVADLVATYAPGYTWSVSAEIGAVAIDEITFTATTLPDCLTQLTRRAGGAWLCDFTKTIRVFFDAADFMTPPRPLNAVHPTLYAFEMERDLSQIVTRAYVEGGGANAATLVPAGETILPLDGDPSWYLPAGGVVVTAAQRLTYTSVSTSTGGGMVGPGAAPSGAPVAAQATGSGIETGAHDYAVTFTTAAGESVAGPRATITVGPVAAPTTPPIVKPVAVGPEPNFAGTARSYAVSFLTAGGETLPGPIDLVATDDCRLPIPETAPTGLTVAGSANGPDPGSHEYSQTFLAGAGETPPGPIGPPVILTPGPLANPSTPPTAQNVPNGGSFNSVTPIGEAQQYCYSYSTRASLIDYSAQTLPSPPVGNITVSNNDTLNPTRSAPVRIGVPTLSNPAIKSIYIWLKSASSGGVVFRLSAALANTPGVPTVYYDTAGTTPSSQAAPTVNTSLVTPAITVTGIAPGPAGTSGRKLYRRSGGAGLRLLTTLADNGSTTYTDTTANSALGVAPPSSNTALLNVQSVTAIPLGVGGLVTGRKLYRSAAGAGQLKLLATLFDNTTTVFTDTIADASLGANAPTATTATANQVALSAIPIGAATVTARKLYRTAANQSQLKLLTTIANNTATTHLDSASLAALGANVPIADTSGLTQPSGSINPGATAIQIANLGPFPPAGWAVIGNGQQVIRYTGVSGSSLTGIPASGPGAIVAAISFNSTITAAPALMGIPATGPGSIRYPILDGDPVSIWIRVDDVPAQTALAALIGGDGVQEHTIQDRRLSAREAAARGRALLDLRRDVRITIHFRTRDVNTRAGAMVDVNLGAPFFLVASFRIQQVTIDFAPTRPPLFPSHTATASSVRYSFEDLIRALTRRES